jgi:hypothetical protein
MKRSTSIADCSQPSMPALEKLPYLTGCITEGLRLSCGATGRLYRINHKRSMQQREWTIPSGCLINMSQSLVLYNPYISPESARFVPERCLGDDNSALDQWLVVFSRESRICVGQHEVNAVHVREYLVLTLVCSTTWAELYMGFATVMHRFQFELRKMVRRDVDP